MGPREPQCWCALESVSRGPGFTLHHFLSGAKVIETLQRATVLLLESSSLIGLFLMKTQPTEFFLCKPHLLQLRNLMMGNTSIGVLGLENRNRYSKEEANCKVSLITVSWICKRI